MPASVGQYALKAIRHGFQLQFQTLAQQKLKIACCLTSSHPWKQCLTSSQSRFRFTEEVGLFVLFKVCWKSSDYFSKDTLVAAQPLLLEPVLFTKQTAN